MADLFTLSNLGTLGMLILLQVVLGFDNLLYISLESKRAPKEKQNYVRKVGIGLAIIFRIGLLFLLVNLIEKINVTLFQVDTHFIAGKFDVHSLIVLVGGVFIMYTATKEIWHMMHIESQGENKKEEKPKSANSIIGMIILMNLVFSFDSILSAMALTDVFAVMATAIVIGGVMMIWLAEKVANFLQKNRMYEVLGLFVLFVVGIMLLSEGGHLAHLHFFGYEITQMSKATFYFVIVTLLIVDIVQSRYQKKLIAEEKMAMKESNKKEA